MRLLLKESLHVFSDHLLEPANEVFPLRKDVRHDGEDDQASVGNQHFLALEERLVLPFVDALVDIVAGGTPHCKVDRADRQVSNEGNSSVDIIAHGFDEFTGLGLRDHRLLFVTAVKGEIDVLLGIVFHLLSLISGELNEVEADLDHDLFHLIDKDRAELLICGRDGKVFDQLDNELRVIFVIEVLLKARVTAQQAG